MNVLPILYLILIQCYVNSANAVDKIWNFDKNPDCFLSEKQWKLMGWYFIRVTYIEVTSIVHSNKINSDASKLREYLVKRLYNHTNVVYQTFTIDQDYKPDNNEHSHEYASPISELSYLNYSAPWFQDDETTKNNRINLPSHTREDEPDFGAIVLAENVDLIDSYLNGLLRHPFTGKRSHYLLLIYKDVHHSDWRRRAGNIIAKLWKVYGILNALIISTCQRDNVIYYVLVYFIFSSYYLFELFKRKNVIDENKKKMFKQVGYYDPYINAKSLGFNITDTWGLVRWVPLRLFNFKDDWILRKEWSLNGHFFTATMFERFPTAVPMYKLPKSFLKTHFMKNVISSRGYGGFDGLVWGNLAEALNFNLHLIKPNHKYGTLLENKTFTGSLGDILYDRADFAYNSRFVIDYGTEEIEFLFPVLGEKVCVIAPSSPKIPEWTAIFKCFRISVWVALFSIATFSGFFWFLLKKIYHLTFRRRKRNRKKFSARDLLTLRASIIKVWTIILGAPIHMPIRNMERFFISTCLVTNLIIAGTFQVKLCIEKINKHIVNA